jgi:hypothetical protein
MARDFSIFFDVPPAKGYGTKHHPFEIALKAKK